MELEHGLELEKIKAGKKGRLVEFGKEEAAGGGRAEKSFSIRRLYSTVRDLNETIKNWKGE
jgi:hypothetical protein